MRQLIGIAAVIAAGAPQASTPRPDSIEMITSRNGYVMRKAYYTEAELNDPVFERQRRLDRPVRCEARERILSRDVRWYEPAAPGEQRCAAVVYVVACDGKAFDVREYGQTRAYLVGLEPDPHPGAQCGSTAEERAAQPDYFARLDSQIRIVEGLSCDAPDMVPDQPLRIWPSTRIGVQTRIDPGLAILTENRRLDFLRRTPEGVITTSGYRMGALPVQFMIEGTVPQQGTNITIVQSIAKSKAGSGYCVTVRAEQAGRVWQRTAVAAHPAPEPGKPVRHIADYDGALPRTSRMLTEALAASMVREPHVPDRR